MEQPIEIKKLNLSKIRPNDNPEDTKRGGFKITIVGKPGLGKSTLIKQIIYNKRFLIPVAVVFSGSEEVNGFYRNLFPSCFIYNEYKPEILEKILERQVHAKKYKLPNSWILVIFDDCMHNTAQFTNETMLKLFKNGRHYNILALFTNQYVLDFKPVLRSLLDGIFLFREQNKATLERLYTNFGGLIPTKSEFINILNTVTREPYSCLYIDNASCNSKPWEECIYWYKASIVPDFKFGCELYQMSE
uniref:ATPase n=1 Tax=Rhinella marina erythrocytic-like virus TaxID=2859906 RepID=A0A8F6YJ10_9VIRU|nr:ATPase [Rhinella marina erythrocytic-like virus]